MAVKKTETPSIDKKKVEAIKESFLRNRDLMDGGRKLKPMAKVKTWIFIKLVQEFPALCM